MIDIETINQEILNLEKKDTSYATIERLAWLYTVKDHLSPTTKLVGRQSGSRFLDACSGVPIESMLKILDEHMSNIEIIYPKEYDLIISKIKERASI